MEWPTKRCYMYVGLVAVGVQEQAGDIHVFVPPLLRNCLTLDDISFSYSHYLPSRTVVLAIVFTVYATLKMSTTMMMMIFNM